MDTNYLDVTELAGDEVSSEQLRRLRARYYWAGQYCQDKDVIEVACGSGQGLGYIAGLAKSFEAGDYSGESLSIARRHYGNRIKLLQFDALYMPFMDHSKDIIILFEAIYYLSNIEKFVEECSRVLRPGGMVFIATANKDLSDFNPSPHAHQYYGVVELNKLFIKYGFQVEFFGDTHTDSVSILQRVLRPVKKLAIAHDLIPKTKTGKQSLKRLVFGKLVKMPAEITSDTAEYLEPFKISGEIPDRVHKVIFCKVSLK